ncbi:MAG TPA: hypothetical protein VMT64_13360, partial [Candidatus Binataceae bacterium]|nr:hypothetical protein [Candidatus Binataceae bacterium]
VLGNLFSDTSSDKQKDNLLVFLTPHVVRNKTDLRSLALDQRTRFTNSLGPREMRDMPASSIRSLYDPTFSVAVPPSADLNMQNGNAVAVPVPGAMPEGDKATPFNTEEIPAPSSSSSGAPAAPVTSPAPVPPLASAAPHGVAASVAALHAASEPMDSGAGAPGDEPVSGGAMSMAPALRAAP